MFRNKFGVCVWYRNDEKKESVAAHVNDRKECSLPNRAIYELDFVNNHNVAADALLYVDGSDFIGRFRVPAMQSVKMQRPDRPNQVSASLP